MKKVDVEITGISPLLMHSFPIFPIEAIEKKTPEEQAEYSAYRNPETKELYIPANCVQRALIGSATYSKGKGRASLQKVAAASIFVSPERIGLGINGYEIDARAVVVPATKGRVIRYRPRINTWKAKFEIEYDDTLIKETELRKIVDDMGSRVGLLDFRPEKKGSFGRCVVTSWKNGK